MTPARLGSAGALGRDDPVALGAPRHVYAAISAFADEFLALAYALRMFFGTLVPTPDATYASGNPIVHLTTPLANACYLFHPKNGVKQVTARIRGNRKCFGNGTDMFGAWIRDPGWKKGRRSLPGLSWFRRDGDLEVHAAHAAHAATHGGHGGLVFRQLAHRRFGGDEQAGDRGRILERSADDLGRVDHAGGDQVLVHVGRGV